MRPTSITHSRSSLLARSGGFTLIELLIVIVIISIITSFAVLSIHFNQNKQLESLSNQIKNTLLLAEQEALIRQVTLRFSFTKTTFQFYEYSGPTESDVSPWTPLTNATLGLHHLPRDSQLTLKVETDTGTEKTPEIIISPSGEITPFTLYLGKKNQSPHYRIVGTENGNIKSEPIDEKD